LHVKKITSNVFAYRRYKPGSPYQINVIYNFKAHIFSCSGFDWFWVFWQNGLFIIGIGNVTMQNVLFVYNDQSPWPITGLQVGVLAGTVVPGNSANWTIPGYVWTQGFTNLLQLLPE